MLKGYKTYVTGVLAIITAVGAYLTGDASIADTTQLTVTALLGIFIRNGINNEVK